MAKKKTIVKTNQQSFIQGNVTVKVKEGNRTIKTINKHNTATVNLFYGIVCALNKFIDSNYLPNYICAGTGTFSGDPVEQFKATTLQHKIDMIMPQVTMLYSPVKNTEDDQPNASIIFQGIIPYRLVRDANITELGIYGSNQGSNNDSMVARVEFTNPIKLQAGQSLYIEWEFSTTGIITNKIETSLDGE